MSKNLIGIIGALEAETKELISKMKENSVKNIAGREFHKGELWNKPVVIVTCGIGKVNAALCTQILIDNFSVKKIIHTGVAGGLEKTLEPGDLVIASSFVQHDMDTTKFGDKLGQVPNMDTFDFPCDSELQKKATIAVNNAISKSPDNWKSITGLIASGDQFIAEKNKSLFIRDTFNAVACEMEGAAVAQTCYLNKIPLVVLRAISDNASTGAVEDYSAFIKKAVARTITVIQELLNIF